MNKSLLNPPVFVILFIAVVVVFAFRYTLFGNYDQLNGADSATWLPSEARNIFSRNNGGSELYEFEISEQGFLDWAADKELGVAPIEGESLKIPRYLYNEIDYEQHWIECTLGFGEKLTDEEAEKAEECLNIGTHIATQGYQGERRGKNHGGYSVVYDSEEGRAYYRWSTH